MILHTNLRQTNNPKQLKKKPLHTGYVSIQFLFLSHHPPSPQFPAPSRLHCWPSAQAFSIALCPTASAAAPCCACCAHTACASDQALGEGPDAVVEVSAP